MGYGSRNNGNIKTFWPDDTESQFFIAHCASLEHIMDRVFQKWGDVDMSKIDISPQHIHTDCLTYDLHDSGDYTDFLCISRHE